MSQKENIFWSVRKTGEEEEMTSYRDLPSIDWDNEEDEDDYDDNEDDEEEDWEDEDSDDGDDDWEDEEEDEDEEEERQTTRSRKHRGSNGEYWSSGARVTSEESYVGAAKGNFDGKTWKPIEYRLTVSIDVPTKSFNSVETIYLGDLQIDGFFMERDYDNDNLPVFLLDVIVPEGIDTRIRRSINKMKELAAMDANPKKKPVMTGTPFHKKSTRRQTTKTVFHIKFYGYCKDNPTDRRSAENRFLIFDDDFVPMSVEDTPERADKLNAKIHGKENWEDDEGNFELEDRMNRKTYTLVSERKTTMCRSIVNAVLPKATLTTAIEVLFSGVDATEEVLLSNLDNVAELEELLLLPIPLLAQLNYLNNYYGYHQENTTMFFDFSAIYLVRKNGKRTVWRKNELRENVFYIPEITSEDAEMRGVIRQGDSMHHCVDRDGHVIYNGSGMADQILGNNTLILDEQQQSKEFVDAGGTFYKTEVTRNNPYVGTWSALRTKEKECIVRLICTQIDITQLTPNKEYKILSDNAEIAAATAGSFRLTCVQDSLIKETDHFISVSIVTLKRVSME